MDRNKVGSSGLVIVLGFKLRAMVRARAKNSSLHLE